MVERKVKSGRYHSASEVIREGLRLLEDQDQLHEMRLKEVRKKIQAGIREIEQGEGLSAEEVFATLALKHEEIRKRMGK